MKMMSCGNFEFLKFPGELRWEPVVYKTPPEATGRPQSNLSKHTEKEDTF